MLYDAYIYRPQFQKDGESVQYSLKNTISNSKPIFEFYRLLEDEAIELKTICDKQGYDVLFNLYFEDEDSKGGI